MARKDAAARAARSPSSANSSGSGSDASPSPSPSPQPPARTLTPYTFSYLLLDLSPIAITVGVYALMWTRGWRVVPVLLPLLQLAGAVYAYIKLRSEMRPKHWATALAGAASMTLHVDAPLKPAPLGGAGQRPHYFSQLRAQAINPLLHPAWKINSRWERLRLAAMAVTLVPFRALATVGILTVLCGILKIVLWGVTVEERIGRPLPPLRYGVLEFLIRNFARALLLFGFGYSQLLGSVEEIGSETRVLDARVAPVIVCNHTSFIDPVLIVTRSIVSAVGAIDNLRAPIIGTICQAIQTITVDRRDDQSRSKVVAEIRKRAQWSTLTDAEKEKIDGPGAATRAWPQILLFPEGTCTSGDALIGFKQGAFVPKRPVQPVTLQYLSERYPLGRFHPSWTAAGPSLLVTLFRMWAEPLNYARMSHLAVMRPTAEELRPEVDCVVFAHRVRRAMADYLGVPITEHSYEDVVLQESALALVGHTKRRRGSSHSDLSLPARADDGSVTHVPNSLVGDPSVERHLRSSLPSTPSASGGGGGPSPLLTHTIEVSRLCAVFDVDLDTVTRHLMRFQQMDVHRRGRVNFHEFLRFFNIDPRADAKDWDGNSPMRRLFELLDEDDNGSLDVREFLVGLALLAEVDPHKANRAEMEEATLRLAFGMFDREGTGRVQVGDLRKIFRRAFPAIADQAAQQVFADVDQSGAISYEQFVDFCHAHPECVQKFRHTLMPSPQA